MKTRKKWREKSGVNRPKGEKSARINFDPEFLSTRTQFPQNQDSENNTIVRDGREKSDVSDK